MLDTTGMPDFGVDAVTTAKAFFSNLLVHADQVKTTGAIEPPLERTDFEALFEKLAAVFADNASVESINGMLGPEQKTRQYAVIETAVRELFSALIASTSIETWEFIRVWNLLDIIAILSDDEKCDPALPFWVVEELLDSQTIAGCRKIFDYLESRRERITAKHFKQKQLIILRSCNELLRRLSRAEDTAFCGRVFIFMFQSFPLGDKSSVNLRGEYHVDNVTTYDQLNGEAEEDEAEKMDTDEPTLPAGTGHTAKAATTSKKQPEAMGPEKLYPIFWHLQESFSQPKKLFDATHFSEFKSGFQATMATFRAIQLQQGSRQSRSSEEKRATKRRRDDRPDDGVSDAFNPKYLTSRDLFELEISDLSFRRYVLVQALIIMDFLLALSAKAKEKLGLLKQQNKSVTYMDQTLSDEDVTWAHNMKRTISEYLKQGAEGPYFCRMVETVLSRDKNWVRWKVENCPPIQRPAIDPKTYRDATKNAQRSMTNKRLRPTAMSSLSLDFLNQVDGETAMERLKAQERYVLPDLNTFRSLISDDDFEIERAADNMTKAAAIESKASKTWRALRIASMTKLEAFDDIDDYEDVDVIFRERTPAGKDTGTEEAADASKMPACMDPVILSGIPCSGKSRLASVLMEKHRGVFERVRRHTTGEAADGDHLLQITPQEFNVMLDGDRFIEFETRSDVRYATSRTAVDAITEAGKVPLLELSCQGASNARDSGFSARVVLIKPPSREAFESRLKSSEIASHRIDAACKAFDEFSEYADPFFQHVILNDDLNTVIQQMTDFIFGIGAGDNNDAADANPDGNQFAPESTDALVAKASCREKSGEAGSGKQH